MMHRVWRIFCGCACVSVMAGVLCAEDDPGTYPGREPDALWRAAAEARIEKHRKGDFRIFVTDTEGNPVPGAKIRVKMTRHAFAWGSAVAAWCVIYNEPDRECYRRYVVENFNRVTLEYDLKWPEWEMEERRWMVGGAIDWLREEKIEIRGHCLVWPGWQWVPGRVRELKEEPGAAEKIAATVLAHIREEAGALGGRVCEWDVVNEPYSNHEVLDAVGLEQLAQWFREAKTADPHARLYLNDFGILTEAGRDVKHQEAYADTIRFLQEQEAPLEGIGMQAHFTPPLTPPARVVEILERFATFGLPIQITEHDIHTADEQLQADYTRDFLTAAFSHPAVSGILTWGFWEGHHWQPEAALVRKDWTLKPAGEVWQRLVKTQWWTDTEAAADENGRCTVRGFLGDYEITAEHTGRKKSVTAKLPPQGAEVRITL